MFTNASDIKQYVLAGNATVTLTSERTEARYTFKVRQAKETTTGALKPLWFVSLLTGPNNEADYQYLGILGADGFRTTAKSRFSPESIPARAWQFFWRHVDGEQLPPEMTVMHSGSCGRCGRKLTVPQSIISGIGPECREKMGM